MATTNNRLFGISSKVAIRKSTQGETQTVAPPLIPHFSISLDKTPATTLPPAGRRPKIRFQRVNKHVDVRTRYVHVRHEPARIQHLGQDAALL